MSERICLVLEALSIVVCLHRLYGRKFKFDIVTLCFLTINMIIMTTINYYELPKIYTMIIYPIIVLYCGIKFGFKIRAMIINNILYLVLIGGIQIAVSMCYGYIFHILFFTNLDLLIINFIAFLLILFVASTIDIAKLSMYLQDKERILIISLLFSIILAISCVINSKIINGAELFQYMPLFITIVLICILSGQLSKFKIISQKAEVEIKMHQMYANSFRNLIEDIRSRQHEFDNQINTIYSQHYMYHTYEDLVNAQKKHCEVVIRENRYNKLLTIGNHGIIGFLYGKFVEIDRIGIEVIYKVNIESFNVEVPVYKLIEILGNLVDNAIDELEVSEEKKVLYVSVIESCGVFEIVVSNRSKFVELDEIDKFFKKGFSKKGSNRGLGLYNVKQICSEYALHIFCQNQSIEGENWLCFTINNKKEAIKIKDTKISIPKRKNLLG